jgi:hypothetical protein
MERASSWLDGSSCNKNNHKPILGFCSYHQTIWIMERASSWLDGSSCNKNNQKPILGFCIYHQTIWIGIMHMHSSIKKHRYMYLHFLTLLVIGLPFHNMPPLALHIHLKSIGFRVLQGLGFTLFFFFFFFFNFVL